MTLHIVPDKWLWPEPGTLEIDPRNRRLVLWTEDGPVSLTPETKVRNLVRAIQDSNSRQVATSAASSLLA